jgi:hypothetical protein
VVIPGELLDRIRRCHAATQTDSLTAVLDLSRITPQVAECFLSVLQLTDAPSGEEMSAQDPQGFTDACRQAALRLAENDVFDGIEFAALISTLIHECRHAHDLRSTWMGAELLFHDLHFYAGVGRLLDRLAQWQAVSPSRRVPLPVVPALDLFEGEFSDIAESVRRALAIRGKVQRWWNTKSFGPTFPGHSVHDLFEFVAFSIQIDWLAGVFGHEAARLVSLALTEEGGKFADYARPWVPIAALSQARGRPFEPALQDASRLVWSAMNANGIAPTIDNGRATKIHPGTWFGLFGERLVDAADHAEVPDGLESAWAAEDVLERRGVPGPVERFSAASDALDEMMRSSFPSLETPEPALVATEVAIDFRHMCGLIIEHPDYHIPQRYVDYLISGELIGVHVRIIDRNQLDHDFRTPSWVPHNHIGGARVASEASQQMRLLVEGAGMTVHQPYSAAVLATMRGHGGVGLRFRVLPPAEG